MALHLRLLANDSNDPVSVMARTAQREYRFAAHHVGFGSGIRKRLESAGLRDWKFDFALPEIMLAIECEGGAWAKRKTRHTTGTGFHDDLIKYDAAMRLGWTVYRCDLKMIETLRAYETIKQLIGQKMT
jgi:hypothetical protein